MVKEKTGLINLKRSRNQLFALVILSLRQPGSHSFSLTVSRGRRGTRVKICYILLGILRDAVQAGIALVGAAEVTFINAHTLATATTTTI